MHYRNTLIRQSSIMVALSSVRFAAATPRAGFTSTKDQAVWCSEAERLVRIANGHPMHLFAA